MSSMNFTCDGCGREVFSCTFVNGMKFCAKCYQEIKPLREAVSKMYEGKKHRGRTSRRYYG